MTFSKISKKAITQMKQFRKNQMKVLRRNWKNTLKKPNNILTKQSLNSKISSKTMRNIQTQIIIKSHTHPTIYQGLTPKINPITRGALTVLAQVR